MSYDFLCSSNKQFTMSSMVHKLHWELTNYNLSQQLQCIITSERVKNRAFQQVHILNYCRHSGNGGPQTCLPAAYGMAQGAAQHGPSSSTRAQDPREGPSLAGRTTGGFLRHGLVRLAREEAERSRQGTSRGARDASHDDQGRQAGASPRSVLLSSLV